MIEEKVKNYLLFVIVEGNATVVQCSIQEENFNNDDEIFKGLFSYCLDITNSCWSSGRGPWVEVLSKQEIKRSRKLLLSAIKKKTSKCRILS